MATNKRCADTAHDFDKFDDATIYCRKCGEQRVMDLQAAIAKLPQPVYMPCPLPHWPQWTPVYPSWLPTTTPFITITSGSTGRYDDTGTYQLSSSMVES